jgi:hypothetical protein
MRHRLGSLAVSVVVIALLTGMDDPKFPSHCAVQLHAGDPNGKAMDHATLVGCYATFAEAVAAGSDGAIRLDEAAAPASLTDAMVQEATVQAAGNVLIGTEFTETSFDGESKSYFAPNACSGSQVWEVSYVTDAWNDDFESGKGFGGCDHNKKFAASNFGGAVITCTPNCTNYGALANEVSSLRWRP